MKLKFNNRARFAGRIDEQAYFDWQVFVDEADQNLLEEIDNVTYFLHKSYPEPVRVSENASQGFQVHSRGWGNFDIGVQVEFKDGHTEQGVYHLDLSKPWDEE